MTLPGVNHLPRHAAVDAVALEETPQGVNGETIFLTTCGDLELTKQLLEVFIQLLDVQPVVAGRKPRARGRREKPLTRRLGTPFEQLPQTGMNRHLPVFSGLRASAGTRDDMQPVTIEVDVDLEQVLLCGAYLQSEIQLTLSVR